MELSVTTTLAWRKPAQVEWLSSPEGKVLFGDQWDEWKPCAPLKQPNLWGRFALPDATEKQIRSLCLQYGALRHPDQFSRCQYLSYWRRELRDLWLVGQCIALLKGGEPPGIDTRIRRFLNPEDVWTLSPFLDEVVEFGRNRDYSTSVLDRSSHIEGEEPSDAIYEVDHDHDREQESAFELRAADTDYSASLKEVAAVWREKEGVPRPEVDRLHGFMQWTEARLQRAVSRTISQRTAAIDIRIDPASSQLFLVPPDLRTGLWLQLAQTFAGSRIPTSCLNCGKLFIPTRAGHVYCRKACAVAASRRKEKEAQSVTTVSLPAPNETESTLIKPKKRRKKERV